MIRFWAAVVLVLVADQVTKLLVIQNLERGLTYPVLEGVVGLTFILNPGGAFGLLASSDLLLSVIAALAVVLMVVAHSYLVRTGYGPAAALLLGGAMGNLADRIRLGAVVDFIDFGFWPVFNVADIAIVAGALLLLHRMLIREGILGR